MKNRMINFNNVLIDKKELEEVKKKIKSKEIEKKTFYLLDELYTQDASSGELTLKKK